MVLPGAWEVQVITEEQMKQLHEGLRRMGKQFVLDTLVDINVRHNYGFRILFFSYVDLHLILLYCILPSRYAPGCGWGHSGKCKFAFMTACVIHWASCSSSQRA